MKTAMQELIRFINNEVALGFLDKKYAERLKWYIDTCFIKKEKEQIENAYDSGCTGEVFELNCNESAEDYYNKTYANDTTKGLPEEDSKRRAWHY